MKSGFPRVAARALTIAVAGVFTLGLAAPSLAATQIAKKIKYHPMSGASPKVKDECQLDTKIPEFFAEELPDVKLVNKPSGRRLILTIRDVHAPPGGMFSGPKWIRVDGELKSGGKTLGTFRAKRNTVSGGGTCGMLHKIGKVIAKDVAEWIQSPTTDARLGNAK